MTGVQTCALPICYIIDSEATLTFESACKNLCSMFTINPIVPRLAALDETAFDFIEMKFGFPKKALASFIISLSNLPIFVLEGMALRELKKMIYIKELFYNNNNNNNNNDNNNHNKIIIKNNIMTTILNWRDRGRERQR